MAEHPPTYLNGFTNRYAIILQTITVVALFVAGFWAAVVSPMQGQINDRVTLEAHNEFVRRTDQSIEQIRDQIKQLTPREELQVRWDILTKLSNEIVPRGENAEHWLSIANQIAEENRQIDSMRNQLGSAYTLADEVRRLQQQIDQLNHPAVSIPVSPPTSVNVSPGR